MSNAVHTHPSLTAGIDSDRRKFRLLFRMTFLFFVLSALLGRMLPKSWRPFATRQARQESVVDEARRVANTILPFVFVR
ncbi:MAG: hypothetical protein QNJ91_02575 [Gammaproteobacteria bacterium]|nr:hypothetical protein [Gammaproteobacteria bacterium]